MISRVAVGKQNCIFISYAQMRLLSFDDTKRITANECVNLKYFEDLHDPSDEPV